MSVITVKPEIITISTISASVIPSSLSLLKLDTSSKLSFTTRDWKYQEGDVVTISAAGFSAPLVNGIRAGNPTDGTVVSVKKA